MEPNLHLWLIPLLPLAGAAVNGIFGKRFSPRLIATLASGVVAVSFLLAVRAFFGFQDLQEMAVIENHFPWIAAGSFEVGFTFYWDALSAVMALVVTGVGLLIHIYSAGYMAGDPGLYRYFSYLNLFLFFMLTLVLAGNYLLLFVGWEGVGLCSYLLIGYYFRQQDASDAGKKAFLVNRLGDLGILLALFMMYATFGSLDFSVVLPAAMQLPEETSGGGVLTAIGLLLLLGAAGKSAQIPLYVWLPDAMLGPTPVSALIHAATMVTAGVYMIARSGALYLQAPEALAAVAVIGCLTALYAATIGVVQTDIKRVLAYSTISQLGYMVMACGVAAFSAAVFHLMTHAFFKALLFLGAGSVIHALGGEQDLRKMGGLRRHLPKTYWTFLIACLAIAALPPFSGFFSKDQILWEAYASPYGGVFFWAAGVATAGITSFYMFRLFFITFHGERRVAKEPAALEHPAAHGHAAGGVHESPPVMTWPLILLAVLSLAGGWIGIPALFGGGDHWNHFLAPVLGSPLAAEHGAPHEAATELLFTGISLLVSLGGIALAYQFYVRRPSVPAALAERWRGLHQVVLNKYYVDEMYGLVFVRPLVAASTEFLWKVVDVMAIDGIVNGVAERTRGMGDTLRRMQSGHIRSYAGWLLLGAVFLIGYMITATS